MKTIAQRPIDVAVNHTLEFLGRALPAPTCRVLEVGCGSGDLALQLAARGHQVTAIDTSTEAVAAARKAGVAAQQADILTFDTGTFDAVLFTRSLHHISSLQCAIDRAAALAGPNGLIVLEEFAVEEIDHATARWNYDTQTILQCAGLTPQADDGQSSSCDPIARWREDHHHTPPLNTGRAMIEAVERRCEVCTIERSAYLYRFFCARLESGDRGCRTAEALFAAEQRLITGRLIRPVGLRIVARVQSGVR